MLLLRVGDAAERRTEVDPDPLRRGGAAGSGDERGVLERQATRHEPELAEPVELARGLGRHPGERVEVIDLGGDLRAERAGVEAVDAADGGPSRSEAGPERVPSGPDGGDDADPRDPDARRSVTGPARVALSDGSASASASALNVASVLPAIGRVNTRSTNHGNPGIGGRKSWSIATRVPSAVGSIRQVTSMPLVAPATWTKRRRSASGSDHVRARHATGSPSPSRGRPGAVRRSPRRGRRRPARLGHPRAGVMGEEPLPALDAAASRKTSSGAASTSMLIVLRTSVRSRSVMARAARRDSAGRGCGSPR